MTASIEDIAVIIELDFITERSYKKCVVYQNRNLKLAVHPLCKNFYIMKRLGTEARGNRCDLLPRCKEKARKKR